MYPIEDDFGLGHPTPTLLLDYPTLDDDYDYDDYILLPLTLPGVLIPLPARAAEEPYSEVRRWHKRLTGVFCSRFVGWRVAADAARPGTGLVGI